ncbi:MAG: PP2C family protein-serine/threonine phosphatase [Flavobacteriales bacterium]
MRKSAIIVAMKEMARHDTNKELWKYIFSIFPLIDVPFGILCVFCSANWVATLCMLPLFPIVAVLILKYCDRKNLQPGYLIFLINGSIYFLFAYLSGHNTPTWLMLINMTVGSSFMFNKPLTGRIFLFLFTVLVSFFNYYRGGETLESLIIFLSLTAFHVLFNRTYLYSQIQQRRIEQKNDEIESQRLELEHKNKDILASISYARRIQHAVLPGEESIYRAIPLSFIIYRPKDIVSGDFFWFHEVDESRYIIACGDCTGHGVPGAMMTVVGSSALNHIVVENKVILPSKILSELDSHISATLRQQREHEYFVHDGMDISLVLVDKKEKKLIISSAKRPVIHITENQLIEIAGAKTSLGGINDAEKKFFDKEITFQTEDVLYMYTDGITDQFGGPEQRKFSKRRLHESLLKIHSLKMSEQKARLETTIEQWQSGQEQIDDILMMGLKF